MFIPHLLTLLGWNRRSLTFTDFEEACAQQEIIIQRADIKTAGMYFVCDDQPFITLSNQIEGVRLWLVAFHELTHHLLHPPGLRCFSPGSVSKAEAEAQILAICSVIDEATLYRILREGELHDFPKDMMRLRTRVVERFKI
jgi:Zn-dependent peptidase ImmA (M78 family)